MIINPLRIFSNHVERRNAGKNKKGLIIGHGHNHSNNIFFRIKNINYWYMVDRNISVWPDYLCDAADEEHMKYFPDESFDCVMTAYCGVLVKCRGNDRMQFVDILKNMHRIVKKNGIVAFAELPGLFYWFIKPHEYEEIVAFIKKTITTDDLQKFTDLLNEKKICKKGANDTEIYHEILVKNYRGPNKEELNGHIKKISIEYSKRFLLENNFEFVEIKNKLLIAKPIFPEQNQIIESVHTI